MLLQFQHTDPASGKTKTVFENLSTAKRVTIEGRAIVFTHGLKDSVYIFRDSELHEFRRVADMVQAYASASAYKALSVPEDEV